MIFRVKVNGANLQWGEAVAAALVSCNKPAIDSEEIDRFCIQHVARFKRPKRYIVADELPKNATGKVLKTEVKRLFLKSV